MTTETQVRLPVSESAEFVKGINLTSATTLVIGSMIGSGIFIVSADIARLVESPALLILAWVVTGFMTVVGALTYGELAAMMPKAGGQYVFLRESLGPLWGFLYGWSMFLVIQTGTIAAVGVAFGKFLGVLFPAISADKWLWHIGHIPKWTIGVLVLGNMDVGLNWQNLVAIGTVVLLTGINVLGVRTGALVQNIFTFSKTAALFGLVLLGAVLGHNADAISQNFGHFWQNASFSALHPVQVGIGGPIVLVGLLTIVAVAQVGSLFSSDAWNNVTFTAAEVENPRRNVPLSLAVGTGIVTLLYIAANFVYLMVLPLHGDAHGTTVLARGIQYAADDGLCVDRPTLTFTQAPCDESKNQVSASKALQDAVLYRDLIDAMSMRDFKPAAQSGHDHFFDTFGRFRVAARAHTVEMIAEVASRAARQAATSRR